MASVPPSMPSPAPFIVTAELPPDIFAWGDSLRRAHFPAERNVLSAHVTLFHSFAPSLHAELLRTLGDFAGQFAPPDGVVEGLMNLGKGTALAIRSPQMLAVRQRIAERFHGSLTPQDRHTPRLHITIQNKVSAEAARELQRELAGFSPRAFRFTGLGLHIYRVTHWEGQGTWSFRGKDHA
ncbi:2'-5' RNA ligase family protein [Novosphingobium sp.]|uniref:2'-5' RNA ligase family protein n=1 Tax=Novosphingobium sp. TaxID=1874826 RepID=UPI0025DBCBAB|nr:2'-5' RNA ligase family protein [Novosphingobium sp.]